MRDFNRRRGRRKEILRFAAHLAGVLVLLVVTVTAVRGAWEMYGKFSSSAAADAVAQQNLASLKLQESQVNAAVASLSSSEGVETQMRERYGVARPGEGEIQIVKDAASTTPAEPASSNIFSRIFHALFPW
ncbi:MAG: hypothetical protein KGH79_02060 [Patescibacteria group bacterium]|nr:hypothetical protein [Patescibacteria group bacterium]